MNDTDRHAKNSRELATCYAPFADKIRAIITDLEGHGWHPRILQGYRSPAEQMEAYNSGHSKLKFGFHNITTSDGSGAACAVDIIDESDPEGNKPEFFLWLLSAAKSHGLTTGALWGLTDRQKVVVLTAIHERDWKRSVRLGWDQGHVEYPGFTARELQKKVRGE